MPRGTTRNRTAATFAALMTAVSVPSAAVSAVHVDPGGTDRPYYLPAPPKPPKVKTKTQPGSGESPSSYTGNQGAVYVPCDDLPNGCKRSAEQTAKEERAAKAAASAKAKKDAVAITAKVANDYSGWLLERFGSLSEVK